MTQAHFVTLGCRLNQLETESIAHIFENSGNFTCSFSDITARTKDDFDTKIVVINTCAVTTKAQQKARRLLRLLLDKFSEATIIVTGCYAQLSYKELKSICERIVVAPVQKKDLFVAVPAMLLQIGFELSPKIIASALQEYFDTNKADTRFELYTPIFKAHTRALLKIQDGCDNSCSFCCIHNARGKSISLQPQIVLERVKELEHLGQKEVVFTGVNLCQYSFDTTTDLATLLAMCLKETHNIYFALSSLHPDAITPKLCDILASTRVQPRFHLSVQSGSDNILKLMQRHYTSSTVLRATKMLRNIKDSPFISADIIAGFPTESDSDFLATIDLCHKADFSWIHAFTFSPRPNTLAYNLKPQVPVNIATSRTKELTILAKSAKLSYISSFIDKPLLAIAENARGNHCAKEGFTNCVVTQNLIHATLDSTYIKVGSLVTICIKSVLENAIQNEEEIQASATIIREES